MHASSTACLTCSAACGLHQLAGASKGRSDPAAPLAGCPLQGVMVGSRLFVFGGEDVLRRPLGELLVLDMQTMQWSRPETTGALS